MDMRHSCSIECLWSELRPWT